MGRPPSEPSCLWNEEWKPGNQIWRRGNPKRSGEVYLDYVILDDAATGLPQLGFRSSASALGQNGRATFIGTPRPQSFLRHFPARKETRPRLDLVARPSLRAASTQPKELDANRRRADTRAVMRRSSRNLRCGNATSSVITERISRPEAAGRILRIA